MALLRDTLAPGRPAIRAASIIDEVHGAAVAGAGRMPSNPSAPARSASWRPVASTALFLSATRHSYRESFTALLELLDPHVRAAIGIPAHSAPAAVPHRQPGAPLDFIDYDEPVMRTRAWMTGCNRPSRAPGLQSTSRGWPDSGPIRPMSRSEHHWLAASTSHGLSESGALAQDQAPVCGVISAAKASPEMAFVSTCHGHGNRRSVSRP